MPHTLIFGFGYVGQHLAKALLLKGHQVTITTRQAEKCEDIKALGATPLLFGKKLPVAQFTLSTAPPQDGEDPVLKKYKKQLIKMSPQWVGYLSTTGVYGDADGEVVTEKSPTLPISRRAKVRKAIEGEYFSTPLPVHIFRLSGIYGPGRSVAEKVKAGTLSTLPAGDGPINRAHVEDIVKVLMASMAAPKAGEIYNVADDDPAPTREVVLYAAEKMGIDLSQIPSAEPKELGFMGDGHRVVNNEKIKQDLKVTLTYPTFREGLKGS